MRTVLTCTLVAALLQQAPLAPPPRDSRAPEAVKEGTGTIKGRVYDRETGAPVANAVVTLAVDFSSQRAGAAPSARPAGGLSSAGPAAPGEDRRPRPLRVRAVAGRHLLPLVEPAGIQGHLPAAVVRRAAPVGSDAPATPPSPAARGRPDARECRPAAVAVAGDYGARQRRVRANRWPAFRSWRRSPGTNQRSAMRGPYRSSRTIAARSGCSGWRRDDTSICASPQGICPAAEATSRPSDT